MNRAQPARSAVLTGALGGLPAVCRAVAWICAVVMNAPIVVHVARGSRAYLGYFADDFFYYVVIADNLIAHGHLTFDGVHATNGFHPLWFCVIALMRLAFGTGGAFYVAIAGVDAVLAIVTFELYVELGRALGGRVTVVYVAAAYMELAINRAFADGMEANLAVPLTAALLLMVARTGAVTPRRAAELGVLSSLTVLARLDSGILVAMMTSGYVVLSRDAVRRKVRALVAFGAAGALLPIYLAFNLVSFGALLPVSAAAKLMSTRFGVNWGFLRRVVSLNTGPEAFLVPLLALVLLALGFPRAASREARFAAALAIVFPAAYYAACALQSPWLCYPWYAYALYSALLVGLVVVGEAVAARLATVTVVWLACLACYAAVLRVTVGSVRFAYRHAYEWGVEDNLLAANGFEVARRMHDRPGMYGMGDKAGSVAVLLNQPVVQLEGLAADRALLHHIREEAPLGDVLREYGVDYLIVTVGPTVPLPKHDGCYEISEPNSDEAGDRAPKMRGRFCAEPIVDYEVFPTAHRWSNFNFLMHTYVFDVRGGAPGSWR